MSNAEYELQSLLDKSTRSESSISTVAEKQENAKKIEAEISESEAPETTSLEKIVETKQQISQVKASLGTIIDTMAQNPSIFNRVATYYGEFPLWQKIAIGVGISVPTLAMGIFAEIGALLVIGGVTVVAYTATGIVLDDHHHCNVNIAERLKAGIISLADVLELTIKALDRISEKLAEEIEKFKQENLKLATHVTDLGDQIESLSSQVELYIETEKLLRGTKENLERTAENLNKSVTNQSELLRQNQEELARVSKAYNRSQKQLSEKIGELTSVRVSMGKEVDKAKKLAATLERTITALSGSVIDDKKQREAFQNKLEHFIGEKESGYEFVADRLGDAERELSFGKEEFKFANSRYNELLKRQETLVARLEELDNKLSSEQLKPKEHVAELLALNGIYAPKTVPDVPSRQGLTADPCI
ncbi:membrane protein [Legionella antarctica]|uniref:Membrane protein n=1 Tax=Legionella antarctica TaxID=2708020 RepID=A0A6F8T3H4_9GAMM|nr:LegC2/C7 family Dot/Icm T4SS effector [Legionella antarctica]BCA94572.1 membrane protein [Legionella antarctica]